MTETNEHKVDRKERMKIPHTPYAVRPVQERLKDFKEVKIGYDAESAMLEASRCIQCPQPKCIEACPLNNDIKEAMWLISQGNFIGAAQVYRQTNIFPEICGRVCPQEKLCEGACPLGKRAEPPSLGALEAFVSDYQRMQGGWPISDVTPPSGKSVAVVGSGPSGMAVAESLTKRGHAVTVYETMPRAGGLLMYGIPNFKLDKSLVGQKVDAMEKMGVQFIYEICVGKDISVDELLESGFDVVYLAVGANIDASLRAPGVDLKGIYYSGEYLLRTVPPKDALPEPLQFTPETGRRAAIIGGGDTATDCMRTALRLGAEHVVCYYRRSEEEMPGSKKERKLAIEEGACIEYLVAPVSFEGDSSGHVSSMTLQRMELGEPDESGRRRPVPIDGAKFEVPVDTVVLALGYWPDETISKNTPNLETHDWGLITADPQTGKTSRREVFAGGDAVTGPDLVSTAVAAGLRAADAIHDYLMS